jgi:tRNA pseudouridine55 synthase
MEGILLIDKPEGWTSFDVVNYVRKIVARVEGKKPRNIKVGHTGTLDPMATGLLVLCVGKTYTKKVPILIKHDKTYIAEITFGAKSTTGDAEGTILPDSTMTECTIADFNAVTPSFIGNIQQKPPAYSAVKVNGKRAYELAREGKEVVTKEREVTVHDLYVQSFDWPKVKLVCHVGSGTYIRVLAEDIGKALGTNGYLSALRRTVVDTWSVDQALTIDEVSEESIRDNLLE